MTEQAIVKTIMEVPVASKTGRGYVPEWVTNFRLTRGQGETLRRLKSGLIGVGATLASGRRVESDASVFQWLLENVSKAAGGTGGDDDTPEYVEDEKDLKDGRDIKDGKGGKDGGDPPVVDASRKDGKKTATGPVALHSDGGLPGTEQIAK